MAWNAPDTPATGFLVTAAYWAQQIRDNFLLLATYIETATGRWAGEIKTFREEVTTVAFSATPTFDLSLSNNFLFGVLTGNVTSITVSNWTASKFQTVTIRLKQDGTGGRTVAFPGGWLWDSGAVPTMPTGANKTMVVILASFDGGTTIFPSLFNSNA